MNYNGRLMTANENLQFGSQKEHLNEQGSGNRQNSKLHIFTNQNQKHREFSPPLPSSCVSCLSREFGILRPIFLNERSKEFNRTHVTRPGSFLNNRKSTTSNLNKENKRTGNSFFIDKPFQHGSVSFPEDHQVSQIFHSNSASKEFPSSYFQNNSSDEILKSPQKFRSNSSHRNIVEQERVSQAYQGQFQSFHTVLFTPSSHSIPPEDRISQGRSVQYTGTQTIPSNQPFKNALSGEKITQDLSRKHQSPQTFRDNPFHRTIPTRKSLPQDNSEQYEDSMVVQPNLSENVALRDPSKQYQYSRTVPSNPSFQNTPSKKSISQGYPGHNQGPQTGQPNLSLQNIGSQGRIRQHQGPQSSQFNPSSQNTLTQVNPLKNRPEYHHERFSSFNKNNQFQLFNQGLKTGLKESKNSLKFRTNKFTNIAKPNQQNTILLRQPDILSTDSFENSNLNENSPHNNEELSEQPNTPTFPSSFQEKKLETGFGEAQGMRNLDRIRVFQSNGRLSSVFNPASEQQILLQTEENVRGSSKNKLEINEGNKQTVKENFDENSKLFDTSVHSTLNNENVRGSKSDLKQEMIVRLNSIVKQNDNKNLASPETFGISKMVLNGEERLKNNSNSFSNTNILDQKAVSISDFQQNSNHFQKGIRNNNSINSGKEEVLLTDFERENEKHSEQAGQSLFPNQGMSVPINNHEFRQNFARIPDDNSHQDKGDEELEEFVNGRHSVPSRHWEDPGPTDETWERSRPMDNRDPWWEEDPWNNEPEPWRYENPRDNNLESRWHDEMWDNDPNPWGDTRDPWWQENPRHINRNPWWQDDPWKNEPYQPWKINDNSQGKRGMCWKNHNKKNYHKGFMQNRRHFSGKNKWYQQYNQKMNGWNRIMWQRKPFSIWQMFKLMG
ncbi:uncharacterized protein LOC143229507 [Tachypleus tridentatus]|uniref:uncharacterized protein LOC143229507 n=1 Tax=Tachypleus tridentatus TaxID=6853 RepID=UPI003FD1FFF4